jgi:2,3-dihydroxyphenylpropionate 1,2-dioxygenase
MSQRQVGGIVAAVGMTHTPGLGHMLHVPEAGQVKRIADGFAIAQRQLEQARPDVIVAFVNDHFDMFTLQGMPGFAIAVGDTHWGPTPETEAWIQMKRGPVPGDSQLAFEIYRSLMSDGFELHRVESAEFIHNVLMPKKFLWPDRQIPVVPVFINCFIPPLPTWRRAYELGRAIRKVVSTGPKRVALLASGGISHWPPIVTDDLEAGDPLVPRLKEWHRLGREAMRADPTLPLAIMERETVMAASGRALINVEWDRGILQQLANADVEQLTKLDHEAVRAAGGSGGAEMLLWVALMGAMYDAKADIVMYEAVKEWMGGVGLISYASSLQGDWRAQSGIDRGS